MLILILPYLCLAQELGTNNTNSICSSNYLKSCRETCGKQIIKTCECSDDRLIVQCEESDNILIYSLIISGILVIFLSIITITLLCRSRSKRKNPNDEVENPPVALEEPYSSSDRSSTVIMEEVSSKRTPPPPEFPDPGDPRANIPRTPPPSLANSRRLSTASEDHMDELVETLNRRRASSDSVKPWTTGQYSPMPFKSANVMARGTDTAYGTMPTKPAKKRSVRNILRFNSANEYSTAGFNI